MEDTLRVVDADDETENDGGLNPCFNGRYSQSAATNKEVCEHWSLNPCFNGRYSQSFSGCVMPHNV